MPTSILSNKSLCVSFFATFFTIALSQTTHTVAVGVTGSFYDPPTVSALSGDIVTFVFVNGAHGITQSSLNNPCTPLVGGFNSGIINAEDPAQPKKSWSLVINDTSPIWYFCQSTIPQLHCTVGMVGAINPPSTDTYSSYVMAAKLVTNPPVPTPTFTATGVGAFATGPPSVAPSASILSFSSSTTSIASSSTTTQTSWTPLPTFSTTSSHNIKAGVIAGAIVGGFIILIIIISLIVLLFCRRKSRRGSRITPFDTQTSSTASVRPLTSESSIGFSPSSLHIKQPIINEIMPHRRPTHGESRQSSAPSLVRSGRSNSHSSLRLHDHPYRGGRHIAELSPVPEAKLPRHPAPSHRSTYSESATQPSSLRSYEHFDINALARHVANLISAPGAADSPSSSDITVPNTLESVKAKYRDMGPFQIYSPPGYTFPPSR